VAWWIGYTIATAAALERPHHNTAKASLVFKRDKNTANMMRKSLDEENGKSSSTLAPSFEADGSDSLQLARNEAVFTWENLSYTVSVPGGHRKLLDEVTGWVKPGTLGALMGSSGAGKTTLLDVLAQRKDAGVIEGSILVNGRPLPVSFQRSAGYCEQMDVHEPTATVREALIISARLRQPSEVPDSEKLDYVNSIIKLLEMEDIENAIIGGNSILEPHLTIKDY
jgi:ATP-binding cassette subfamily G (WHITE) protein 2 (SNQ2)